jgi:hypothetical protein
MLTLIGNTIGVYLLLYYMKYQIYEGVDVVTYGSQVVCFDLMSLGVRNCNDVNANNLCRLHANFYLYGPCFMVAVIDLGQHVKSYDSVSAVIPQITEGLIYHENSRGHSWEPT